MRRISPGREHATVFALGIQLSLTHQPGDSFARDLAPLIFDLPTNPWRSIPALVLIKHLANGLRELSIFSMTLAGGALAPSVKAAFGNLKDSTHDDDGKLLLVLFDKLISHLDSREKMLIAFFSISRS